MSISSKIFGSKVSGNIKKRIEALQKLSKANAKPGEIIVDTEIQELLGTNNQDITGYLSSQTPIARLWTAVQIAEDTNKETFDSKAKLRQFDKEKKLTDNEWIKSLDDTFELHEWIYTADSTKIYQIGNHQLNTTVNDPLSPNYNETTAAGNLSAIDSQRLTPFEQETDMNAFLKPPAGITSVDWETNGPLGVLKKATVKFVVHNFSDFERIYMRYFLRPGAHVFLDVGWDTAALYNPKTLIEGDLNQLNKSLYGDTGYIEASKGGLDVLHGLVMNYDVSIRSDGGFDCSLEIISKNAAVIDNPIDKFFKKRVEKGLQTEILGLAVSGRLGNDSFYEKTKKWGQSEESQAELAYVIEEKAKELLGGRSSRLPGEGGDAEAVINEGIYFGGLSNEDIKVYVSFGFLEDKILNKELAFANTESELTNSNNANSSNEKPEDDMKAKFDSRNSYITYSKNLHLAMRQREGYKGAFFLYPGDWGSKYATYNTKRKMVPDDRLKSIGDDGIYENALNGSTFVINDKKSNRIPLREVFISLDGFISIIKGSSSGAEVLQSIADKINSASFEICNCKMGTNNYGAHTISIVDTNVLNQADGNIIKKGSGRQEFLDSLLKFKPFSPNTIVKDFSFDYKMPSGGLGSILAIQNIGDTGRHLATDSILESLLADQEVNTYNPEAKDLFVKWLPRDSQQAGQRFLKNLVEGSSKSFNFDADDDVFSTTTKANTTNEKLSNSLGKAIDDTKQIKGVKVTKTKSSIVKDPDEDTDDTMSVVDTEYEFYAKRAKRQMTQRNNPLMPIELSLSIHGISGIMPGDLISVDYMPSQYLNNCFFQIMKVSHTIGSTWTTSFETVMRILPPINQVAIDDKKPIVIGKKALVNKNNLPGMSPLIEFLDTKVTPKDLYKIFSDTIPFNINNIWDIHFEKTPPEKTINKEWYVLFEINLKEDYTNLKKFVNHYNTQAKAYYGDDRLKIEDFGYETYYNDYVYKFNIKEHLFKETENSDIKEKKCNSTVVFSAQNNWILCPPNFNFAKYGDNISNLFSVGQETYYDGTNT